MKLSRIKNAQLHRCKDILFADGYLVGFTGRQVLLFDADLRPICARDGFSYVYTGAVSPQGDRILLVSEESRFHVHAFPSLEPLARVTVRAPYNYGLYGEACWSFDGRQVLACVSNGETLGSALRVYNAADFSEFTDFLAEKYRLGDLHPVPELGKYYMIGYRPTDSEACLIWCDGDRFEEYALKECENAVLYTTCDAAHGWVGLSTTDDSVYLYDFRGRLLDVKNLKTREYEISFSDAVCDALDDDEAKTELKALSGALGLEHLSLSDCVRDVVRSRDPNVAYIATDSRAIAYDVSARKIIDQVTLGFGVEKIHELSKGKILISSRTGASLYELR